MRARADYPTSPQFRRGIDRPSSKHSIGARELRAERPSRAHPPPLATSKAVELATIDAARMLAREVAFRLGDLHELMKTRPDLFKAENQKWILDASMRVHSFLARARQAAKRRGGEDDRGRW